jgi:hypothetical protein
METESILSACVDEMYHLEKGIFIHRPDEIIARCGDGHITRRQVKHVIEQRKADGATPEEVKLILHHVPQTIIKPDFQVSNSNLRYPDSVIRVKVFRSWKHGLMVVLDKETDSGRGLITTYPCHAVDAYFFQLKKLNTSAAGETPRSHVPEQAGSDPPIEHYPFG